MMPSFLIVLGAVGAALLQHLGAAAGAQTVPPGASAVPVEQCEATFERQGAQSLLLQFSPCQNGITEQCCERSQSIVGFTKGAPLGGCLCHKRLYDELAAEIDGNSLARAVGVNSAGVQDALDQCGVPYAYGTGASKCPSDQSTGAADSEEHGGDGGEAETEGYEEDDEDDEEDDEEDGEEEGEGEGDGGTKKPSGPATSTRSSSSGGSSKETSTQAGSHRGGRRGSGRRRGAFRPELVRPRLPDLPEPPKFFENAVLPIGSGGIAQAVGQQALDTLTRPFRGSDKGRR